MTSSRNTWMDCLRIAMTWGVVSIHGKIIYDFKPFSAGWIENTIITMPMFCCVPVFLMLSGALVLSKECVADTKLFHRLRKIVLYLLAQFFLCATVSVIANILGGQEYTIVGAAKQFGYYAMGRNYFWVLLVCYICSPLLFAIAENQKLASYFVAIGCIFELLIPVILDVEGIRIPLFSGMLQDLDSIKILVSIGPVFIFFLGFYLDSRVIPFLEEKVQIRKGYLIAFLFAVNVIWLMIAGGRDALNYFGVDNALRVFLDSLFYGRYYGGYVSIFILLLSSAVFCSFKMLLKDVHLREKRLALYHI